MTLLKVRIASLLQYCYDQDRFLAFVSEPACQSPVDSPALDWQQGQQATAETFPPMDLAPSGQRRLSLAGRHSQAAALHRAEGAELGGQGHCLEGECHALGQHQGDGHLPCPAGLP